MATPSIALQIIDACMPCLDFARSRAIEWGPGISGVLFAAGWWWWIDGVACSTSHIPFSQYLPGMVATFALVMINSVRRDEIVQPDNWDDEGIFCRARSWLLLAYACSIGAIAGAVLVVLHHFGQSDEGDRWVGVASIFQVFFVLGSALMFFISRSPGENAGYDSFL